MSKFFGVRSFEQITRAPVLARKPRSVRTVRFASANPEHVVVNRVRSQIQAGGTDPKSGSLHPLQSVVLSRTGTSPSAHRSSDRLKQRF